MSDFVPPYSNETPVSIEDQHAFVDGVSFETKAELYEAEYAELARVRDELYVAILEDDLTAHDLLEQDTLAGIHRSYNESIWTWAGKYRLAETNVGIDPSLIRTRLPEELGTLDWQIEHGDFSPEWIAMNAHHRMVFIHPFVDGNGRVTRLFADCVLLALTGDRVFDWVGGEPYFSALRLCDEIMSPEPLLEVTNTKGIDEE